MMIKVTYFKKLVTGSHTSTILLPFHFGYTSDDLNGAIIKCYEELSKSKTLHLVLRAEIKIHMGSWATKTISLYEYNKLLDLADEPYLTNNAFRQYRKCEPRCECLTEYIERRLKEIDEFNNELQKALNSNEGGR